MSIEKRIDKIEEAIVLLRDLNLNHDERLDDYFRALRESRENFDFKMNALIDAQIRNESDTSELRSSIGELKDSISGLAEASRSQLQRIENLENK